MKIISILLKNGWIINIKKFTLKSENKGGWNMARRKVGRYNEVKVDLASYDYYLRGEGGIGEVLPS